MARKDYSFKKVVNVSYEDAVKKVTEELKKEGFGVLTEIDVKATLKKKLDVNFRKYIILGACNPQLAHKALSAEKDIGLLLPCNVIVYEDDDGRTVVSAMDPIAALSIAEAKGLKPIAETAASKLRNVVNNL